MPNITDTFIRGLPAAPAEHYDTRVPGLVLRVSKGGTKSWSVRYRVRGHATLERITLGSYPFVSLADARRRAAEIKDAAANRSDPKRALQVAKTAVTVAELVAMFVEGHVRPRHRGSMTYERILKKHVVPALGRLPVLDVRRADVAALIARIAATGKREMASKVLVVTSSMFSYAIGQGIIEVNPCQRVPKPSLGIPKDRTLDDEEIIHLWRTLEEIAASNVLRIETGLILKLILVTAQRPGEVVGMARSELDLRAGVWTLPASRAKNGREQVVPLSGLAMRLIEAAMSLREGDRVFQGDPHNEAARVARRVAPLIGLKPWTPHDLRRTAATGMGRLEVDEGVIARCLNHTVTGITAQVYNRHAYLPQKRAALARWADHIEGLLSGAGSNVVPMKSVAR